MYVCICIQYAVGMIVEKRKQTSTIIRNLSYPVVMIVLSLLTAVSIIMVGLNILEIVFDRKRLPAEDDVSTCYLLLLRTSLTYLLHVT